MANWIGAPAVYVEFTYDAMNGEQSCEPASRRSVGGGETGEVGFGLGVIGLDLECALVGGTRGGGLASAGEHDAEIVPAIGILRVDLQGALLFREGFFGLAEGAEELGER